LPSEASRRSAAPVLLAVAAAGLLVRWWFTRHYGPLIEGDAQTYLGIGRLLAAGRLGDYDGGSPPLYGAFLQLFGGSPTLVQTVQSGLGVAISVTIAWLVWRVHPSAGLALVAGLLHALALDALCFESSLVTETLSTAVLLAAMTVLLFALERPRPSPGLVFGLSLLLSIGGLIKPLVLVMLPFAAVALFVRWRGERGCGVIVRVAAAGLFPVALLVGGFSAYNGRTHGVWGPSTMTGYRLTQHVGSVMEDAPDRYRVLRDIFLAHRARQVAETGSPINTIWVAIPDMERATGLPYGRLSREVNAMSLAVARRHPLVLARSIATAWLWFWTRPMYLKPAEAHPASALTALRLVAWIERPVGLSLNFALLALALAWLARPAFRRRLPLLGLLCGAATLTGSVFQAVAEHSDNGRFAVPFLPLVVIAVLVSLPAIGRRSDAVREDSPGSGDVGS
jgi:hypothetical protein